MVERTYLLAEARKRYSLKELNHVYYRIMLDFPKELIMHETREILSEEFRYMPLSQFENELSSILNSYHITRDILLSLHAHDDFFARFRLRNFLFCLV